MIYLVSSLSRSSDQYSRLHTLHRDTSPVHQLSSITTPLTTVGVEVETQTRGIEEQASGVPRVTATSTCIIENHQENKIDVYINLPPYRAESRNTAAGEKCLEYSAANRLIGEVVQSR